MTPTIQDVPGRTLSGRTDPTSLLGQHCWT
jgi:hypothetical protein